MLTDMAQQLARKLHCLAFRLMDIGELEAFLILHLSLGWMVRMEIEPGHSATLTHGDFNWTQRMLDGADVREGGGRP